MRSPRTPVPIRRTWVLKIWDLKKGLYKLRLQP
jgi:hypothetical protein